jgi:hypothetical protein
MASGGVRLQCCQLPGRGSGVTPGGLDNNGSPWERGNRRGVERWRLAYQLAIGRARHGGTLSAGSGSLAYRRRKKGCRVGRLLGQMLNGLVACLQFSKGKLEWIASRTGPKIVDEWENCFRIFSGLIGWIQKIFEFEWKFLNFLKDRNLDIDQGFSSNKFELNILKYDWKA